MDRIEKPATTPDEAGTTAQRLTIMKTRINNIKRAVLQMSKMPDDDSALNYFK